MKTITQLLVIVLLLSGFSYQAALSVSGQAPLSPSVTNITVTITADELEDPGAGCSLREAIRSANGGLAVGGCTMEGTGPVSIYVPDGIYRLTRHGTNENAAVTGDLDITELVSIRGDGIGLTIIDGDDSDRVFDVITGVMDATTISSMTIRNGNSGTGNGGGIRNYTNLVLSGVRIENNRATASGGGIYHVSGPGLGAVLTVQDSWIMSNTIGEPGTGGGIYIGGGSGMELRDTVIDGNQAYLCGGVDNHSEEYVELEYVQVTNNRAQFTGGGFCSRTSTAAGDNVMITDSQFRDNTGVSYGGNVYHESDGNFRIMRSDISGGSAMFGGGFVEISEEPDMNRRTYITNVTFSDNEASLYGGGIYIGGGDLDVTHVTIANNTADQGAGIFVGAVGAYEGVYLKGSIIAFNNTSGDVPANCTGDVFSLGYNLTNTTCFTSAPGNIINRDPLLGSYGVHGSMNDTYTYSLLPGSPAIDAADPGEMLYQDQRGWLRPVDGDGVGAAVNDIGAFEFHLELFLPLIKR